MDSKIGEKFFEVRDKLGEAISSLSLLSGDVEVSPRQVSILRDLLSNLKEPFLFVVAGEVNAGKSTLMNAVFGEELCASDALPMTSEICHFKYASEELDVRVSDTLTELHRPNEFLKDFNIVDTPGTNSIVDNHQDITERFLPVADLVMFTFSVTNPWGGTAWALLDKIHRKWFKNVIFVLQQCDLRTPEEVSAIVEHIRVTSMQRFGAQFPIFPISAKQALLSKTKAVDKERLWEQSRFAALERFIDEVVNSAEVHERKLGNASRASRLVFIEVQEKLDTAKRILQADEELLSGLGDDVDSQRVRTLEKFNAYLRTFDSSFMELGIQATAFLQDRLSPMAAMFGKTDTAIQIEEQIRSGITEAAHRYIDEATIVVEDDLQHLWQQLADIMRDHFDFQLRVGTESGEPDWSQQKSHMRARMLATLKRMLPGLRIGSIINQPMQQRKAVMWFLILLALLSVGGGVAAYFLKLIPQEQLVLVGGIVAAVTLSSLIGFGMFAQRTMQNTVNRFGEHMERQRKQLNQAVKEALTEEVDGFFNDFLRLFEPLHQLCEDHRTRFLPQLNELERIGDIFEEVEKAIGPHAARPVKEEPKPAAAAASGDAPEDGDDIS